MHASLVLLYLHEDVCPLQAWVPTPASTPALVGKAVAIIVPSLALAVHALWVRPFAAAHAWKSGVRAALLVLAAACAAAVAWAGALDLRITSGPRAVSSLTAGSYIIALLFCVVIAVLVGGVALSLLRGIWAEEAALRLRIQALPLRAPARRRPQSVLHSPAESAFVAPAARNVLSDYTIGDEIKIDVQAHTANGVPDASRLMHPVRRPRGVKGTSRRKRKQQSSRDYGVAAVASLLSDASDAGLAGACDAAMASLSSLSTEEAQAASAALLPGLSARLAASLRQDDVLAASAVASLCGAMATLSDHADATMLSRLLEDGVPDLLVTLLRQCVERHGRGRAASSVEPALTQALWLLGNVTADEGAATAFIRAGGAELLVGLLAHSCAGADASLHVCVALASVSAHSDAAAALLDAGVLAALAPFLLPQGRVGPIHASSSHAACGTNSGTSASSSVAEAEAACRALANVVRPCAASEGRPGAAARVCQGLAAAGGVIAGLTEALWTATAPHSSESHPVEPDSFAAIAVDALLGIVRCASLVVSSHPSAECSAAGDDNLSACTSRFAATAHFEAGSLDAALAVASQAAAACIGEAVDVLMDSEACGGRPIRGAAVPPSSSLLDLSAELRCLSLAAHVRKLRAQAHSEC